ncbi:MAG: hypothetical protein RI964_949 [Pseudomonadota bacterium]
MLVPDNIHPEQTIYFNSSIVLEILQRFHEINMFDLYHLSNNKCKMSMPVFILCLDWLFLLDLLVLNEHGKVKLCS